MGTLGHGDTGTWGHWDLGTLGLGDTGTWEHLAITCGHGGTESCGHRDIWLWGHWDTMTLDICGHGGQDRGNNIRRNAARVPLRIPTLLCQVEVKSFSVVDDANFAYISQLSATLARHTLNKMFLLKTVKFPSQI